MQNQPTRLIVVAVAAVLTAVLFGASWFSSNARAGDGNGEAEAAEETSEKPYATRSYEGKVSALREIPDEPKLTLEDAPPVGSTVDHSEKEWREKLTDKEFHILRENGTEPAGSGDLVGNDRTGVYRCAACGAPLFSSHDKFDSKTGWPSYTSPYQKGRLGYSKDEGMMSAYRVEVHCDRCGGHLGHVFADGPEPTGKRYCINSAALDFEPVSSDSD